MNNYRQSKIQQKQQRVDLMNLIKCWVHCVLFYKELYPKQTFTERTMYAISIPVNKSSSVNDYLNEFFNQIQSLLYQINYIEMIILDEQKEVKRYRILIALPLQTTEISTMQKQLDFKKFVGQIKNQLQFSGKYKTDKHHTFKFVIGFRYDQEFTKSDTNLIQKWLPKQQKQLDRQKVLSRLSSPNIELFFIEK